MLIVGLLLAACSVQSGGNSATPTPLQVATPTAAASSIGAADAVARVVALDPRFAGLGPRDPGLVGQGSWYEVAPAASGWNVTVELGWGDCPAGCINHHTWEYAVATDGTVSKVSETGDALPVANASTPGRQPTPQVTPPATSAASKAPSTAIPPSGGPWIVGTASAGPVCPVERNPPDPSCAPKPVGGAMITVRDAGGREIASTTTGADGSYRVAVPAGSVRVEAAPVAGLMHAPAPIDVVVPAGPAALARVDLSYDTGIR
jgi:hypothetical protein